MSPKRRAAGPPPASPGRPWIGWPVLIVTAGALLVSLPLLIHPALPQGSDVFAITHYLQAFMKAFSEGDLYPRWTDQTNRFLGGPSFVIFAPLPFYPAGAASWVTGSVIGGIRLYLIVLMLLTGVSFYLMAREWIGPGPHAAAGAALYLLLPYHVLDVYQRFALPETTAFVFFPLILLFARRTLESAGAGSFAGLSLCYAGLIYTHLVSTLSFSLLLGGWLLWEARGRWGALARPVAALACGVGLAAPTLLPAMVEKAYINIDFVKQMPNGDFRINFIFKDEALPRLGFRDPIKPPVLKSAHSQLMLALVAAAFALAWIPKGEGRRRRDVTVLAAGTGIAYFLQLEISTPVWRIVPELATIQFPWRFQTYMVLTAALLAGIALRASGRGRARAAGIASIAVLALVNLALAAQNAYLKPFNFDQRLPRSAGVVDWVEPALTPVQFEPYLDFKFRRMEFPDHGFVEGEGEVSVTAWTSSRREVRVSSPRGGTVRLRAFWFPGWTGRIDGSPLDLRPSSTHGFVTFDAPAGTHTVEMRFTATPVRRAAAWIGLASIAATAGLAWWARPRTPAAS